MNTLDKLALLYNKIKNGSATEDEIFRYNLEIEKSCIQKDVLINEIKRRAENLK